MKTAVGSPANTEGRLEVLDAWRAMLMLGGLLLHATCLKEQRPFFDAVGLISGSFRMGTFVAISGLLSGYSISKQPPEQWLGRRLVQIGIPTTVGLLVVCPLISVLLLHSQTDAVRDRVHPYDWYHIWFLVGLLFYTIVAYAGHRLDARFGLFQRICTRCQTGGTLQPLVLVGVAAASFVLMSLTNRLIMAEATPALAPLLQFRPIMGYIPVYLLGFTMARAPVFRAMMLAHCLAPLLMLATVATAYLWWYGVVGAPFLSDRPNWWDNFLPIAGAALCPPAVAVLLFRPLATVRRVPRVFCKLSEASFTMYIVHFPLLVLINLGFARVAWNPYAEYAVAVVAAGVGSYALHVLVVRPSPLLSLLLNGRQMPPSCRALPA